MCASAVCYITCSFHDSALAAPGRIGPERQEAANGSVKHDAGMHCHVRLTRIRPILLLFEITRVRVTDRNASRRKWWFDLLLPKASAQIGRQQ